MQVDNHFPFLEHIGAKLSRVDEGMAETTLLVRDIHMQHMGFVHGGVISTLMDNTGWYATIQALPEHYTSVTMDIHINYLSPAKEGYLRCIAQTLKKGKTRSFVEIRLYNGEKLVAFATGNYSHLSISS